MTNMEEEFFKFIYRRQLIWYKRFVLNEPPPWTDDEILRTYKIINVYRELDKCTIYIMDKLKKIKDRKKILINVVFYRFFNQNNLYELLRINLLNDYNNDVKNKINSMFKEIKKSNRPIFNNAYLISSGTKGKPKHESILDNIQKLDINKIITEIDLSKTPIDALITIQKIPMVGPFLGCEIWTDLSYLHFFKQGWSDNDFVNIGPGAKWGLEIIYNKKLNKKEQNELLYNLYNAQKSYLSNIHVLLKEHFRWNDIAFKQAASNYPFLSITNIEGALCEFRKYYNLTRGKGKKRYFYPIMV